MCGPVDVVFVTRTVYLLATKDIAERYGNLLQLQSKLFYKLSRKLLSTVAL